MKKKNTGLMIALVIFGITSLVLGGYIVYDKFSSKNNHQNENTSVYNVNDYVSISDYNFRDYFSNGAAEKLGIVKKIEFKNLPTTLTSEFYEKHYSFTNPAVSDLDMISKLSNEVIYGTSGKILSIYELDKTNRTEEAPGFENIDYTTYDFYSINIDLYKKKIITNQELLEIYKLNSSNVFERILNDIANSHTDDGLLVPTDSQEFDNMSAEKFKKKIKTYIKQINNRFDKIVLYVQKNNVYVAYNEETILQLLGLNSQTHYEYVSSDLETQVLQLTGKIDKKEKKKSNTNNNTNTAIKDKFLNAPLDACSNITLKDSIDSINSLESLSATYTIEKIDNQYFLLLTITAPADNMTVLLGMNDSNNVIITDAESESIKANMSNEDEVSLYSVISASKLLCD